MTTKTSTDLRNPIYNDDDAAREHLETVLWPHGPVCPRCGVMGERITKLAGTSTRPGVYKCKDCRKPFSVTVGTVMERSHIALSKWVMAAHLMAASKKGFSAHELHRCMDISYEGAWFLFHRLREAADDIDETGPLGGSGKPVEADETYIGGKVKNMHASKKPTRTGGIGKKMSVVSLVDRDGRTKSFHVAHVNSANVRDVLVKHIDRASHLMTDESPVYIRVGREFRSHWSVNHNGDQYVKHGGYVHTNSAES